MRNILHTIFFSPGSFVVLLLLSGGLHAQQAEEFAPLGVDSFHTKIGHQATPQIIDVRTPEEFAINHLNGAISVDLRKEDHLKELSKLDKARPVFIYAIQNRRSGILAGELRKEGFSEVYELRSGIGSWIGAGYPYYNSARCGVTLADYKKSISDGGLVLVDIGTKYCGLCRQVRGMIDSLNGQHDPAYKIVEIDLYNDPQLVAALGEVQAVPTVLLYKNEKIVWKRTGLSFTKGDIETEIKKEK
jgi:rhodanese-related sulfurtransferase